MLQNIKDEKTSELIPYFREMDDEEYVENKNIIYDKIPFHGFIRFVFFFPKYFTLNIFIFCFPVFKYISLVTILFHLKNIFL